MSDLHEAFEAWLIRGARGLPARGAARLGLSGVPAAAGAFDALATIDPEPPSSRRCVSPRGSDGRRRGLVPATASTIAVLPVIGAGIGAGGTLRAR